MIVTQDVVTKYDLGNMATDIKLYDEYGLTVTETRTYSRGYQLNGATFTAGLRGDGHVERFVHV